MSEVVRIGPRLVESINVQPQRPSGVTVKPAKEQVVNFNETRKITGPFAVTITPNAGSALTFDFTSPEAVWTINHNLGYFATARVFSLGGMEVDADIRNISLNQIKIYYTQPFAGFARVF